jgi:anti-sigma factor RsiW
VTCRDFAEFLSQYLSGELTALERGEFEAHLAECPACVTYLDTYQKTVQLSKAAYASPEDRVPDEVPEELVQAILAARAKGRTNTSLDADQPRTRPR